MVLGAFMTALFWVLMDFIANAERHVKSRIPEISSTLAANSVVSYWLYYRKSGQRNFDIDEREALNDYILPCKVVHDVTSQRDELGGAFPLYEIRARAKCPPFIRNYGHTAKLSFVEQRYTDYLLASMQDLVLAGIPQEGRFFLGPIYTGGNLVVKDGGHHFFVKRSWNTLPLLVGKEIKFWDKWRDYRQELASRAKRASEAGSMRERKARQKEIELIQKVSQLIEPVFVGYGNFNYLKRYPLTRVSGKRQLPEEYDRFLERGFSRYFKTNLPNAGKLSRLAFGPIYSYGRSQVDEDFYIKSTNNNNGERVTFANGHLLEKRLIGIGNGIKRSFALPRGKNPVTRVFLRDVSSFVQRGENVPGLQKVHPVKDLEGVARNEFNINKGILTFQRSNKRIRLALPKSAFDEVGHIRFRSAGQSAFARAREIQNLYLEYLGNFRRLDPGQFRIDDEKGLLYILEPKIHQAMWVRIGVTDGIRRSYRAPINLAEVVYLGGRVADARVVPGSVVFNSTPARGQQIHAMVLRPRLYAQKNPPSYQIGVFIDRDVEALALDLGRIFPTPTYGLIVSEVPLLIYGTPTRPYTIICTKDVYVSDINPKLESRSFVSIISRGMIWGQRQQKSIKLNRVILFSEADGIYLNVSADPYVGSLSETEKSVFLGSAFLQGTLKNLYYYPESSTKDGYYYHPGRQADFNFFYDESLQEEELHPVFTPTSFRVVKRSF